MSAGEYGALFESLRSVRWPARRRVGRALPGVHQATMRGVSPELLEYRAYRQGDDPRRLDWKLLGRTDRAYVRLSNERALLPTLLVVDASASMDFPDGVESKWRQASRVGAGLAAIAHADGDPVGLAIAARRLVELRPRSRAGVVGEIVRTLGEAVPGGGGSLAALVAAVRRPLRLVLISDLLDEEEALPRAAAALLARGGEVHVVHIVARDELAPPARSMLAVDPENSAVRRPLVPLTRAAYEQAFGAWREAIAQRWRAAGAGFTMVVSDEPAERAIRRIVAPSGRGQEGGR